MRKAIEQLNLSLEYVSSLYELELEDSQGKPRGLGGMRREDRKTPGDQESGRLRVENSRG